MLRNNKKRKKIAHYEKSSKANRRIIEIEAQSISFTHVQMFMHKWMHYIYIYNQCTIINHYIAYSWWTFIWIKRRCCSGSVLLVLLVFCVVFVLFVFFLCLVSIVACCFWLALWFSVKFIYLYAICIFISETDKIRNIYSTMRIIYVEELSVKSGKLNSFYL